MDRIERDGLINASHQRVWPALTWAEHGPLCLGSLCLDSSGLDPVPGNVDGWGHELGEPREHLEK